MRAIYDIRGDQVTNAQTVDAALGLMRGDHRSFGVAWYRTPRAARKAARKLAQRPYRSAAQWRGDAIGYLESMAFNRKTVAACHAENCDAFGAWHNVHVARNNAQYSRDQATAQGFYLP